MNPFAIAALVLVVLALLLLWAGRKHRRETGLPDGQIIYADTGLFKETPRPLYDPELRLTGKPDYLVHAGNEIQPVEVKSCRVSSAAYDSHIYQLMAYCLLAESQFGVRPRCGYLHYPNRTFVFDYTEEMEASIRRLIGEMREKMRQRIIHRSHTQARRCASCGFRSMCDEKIAA